MLEIESRTEVGRMSLVGGALCIDFINTVNSRLGEQPEENLTCYDDLLAWGLHAGAVSESQARALQQEARRDRWQAEAALKSGVALREATYRLLRTAMRGAEPDAADLAVVNAALSAAMARVELVPSPSGYIWTWQEDAVALDRILWPVVRSAAELLTSQALARVHQCSGTDCGWLFVDTSKNHSRRWCTMEGCGNRAKARRHYQRTRTSGSQQM